MPHRQRTTKIPKLVLIKPRIKDLREIYKKMIVYEATTRFNALAQAFQWYDKAITYLIDSKKMPLDVSKALSIAVKSRNLGISSSHDGEKELAYRTAIRKYEIVCACLAPPLIDAVYEQLKARKEHF